MTDAERSIVENLYPLFIHDQWAYSDTLPNEHGVIGSALNGDGQPACSLAEQSEMLAPYWQDSDGHDAFLIRVEERPAGFSLLLSAAAAPDNCDYYVDDFFLLHPYRGKGVGNQAMAQLVRGRPGRWCLDMKARNKPAYGFWCHVVRRLAVGEVAELHMQGDYGAVIRLQFDIAPER